MCIRDSQRRGRGTSSGAGPSPAGRELAGAVGAVDQHSLDVGGVATTADMERCADADHTVHDDLARVTRGLTEATAVGHHHHALDVVLVGRTPADAGEVLPATTLDDSRDYCKAIPRNHPYYITDNTNVNMLVIVIF